ncbi:hypothetical protein B0H10DRAFT_2434330 [Mycena sp. CBHHK59/15]|nr:hypothetical protein B0H10DRAFT_2434330 [Mycena sp. CBHHK59/15]
MEDEHECYAWAIVTPSAEDSVAYFQSAFASAAAKEVACDGYLAVVLEREGSELWKLVTGAKKPWIAYLVQSLSHPLPEFYLPIAPSTVGPRSSVQPGFKWPFEECVIDTANFFSFTPASVDVVGTPHTLPDDIALYFSSMCDSDSAEQIRRMIERRPQFLHAKKEADGFGDDVGSRWTTFSAKSTYIQPIPGQFVAPSTISAHVCYDIESLKNLLPASQCFEDVKAIKRVRARFSRPSTERAIVWNIEQSSLSSLHLPLQPNISDLSNPLLIDLSTEIDRPLTPDRILMPTVWTVEDLELLEEMEEDYDDGDDSDGWDNGYLPAMSESKVLPPPPSFEPHALQVLYFDVYGALIDNESGIFDALKPLLAQSPYRFNRWEALSFYFESEVEVKRRTPSAPYSQILADSPKETPISLQVPGSAVP